jgi:hypothetical protein
LHPRIHRSVISEFAGVVPLQHTLADDAPVTPRGNHHHHRLQRVEEVRKPSVVRPGRPCSVAPP